MDGIIAPRKFSPGEIIYIAQPFVEFLCRKFKDVACESCHQRSANLKRCKNCLEVSYCGKDCQKEDWENHKLECKYLKNLPSDDTAIIDEVRLVGNIILKLKGKDWKTFKSSILGIDVSFDDINPRLEEIAENNLLSLQCKSLKEYVKMYIREKNMPSDDDFRKIFGKVSDRTLSGKTTADGYESISYDISVSLFECGCIPNCFITGQGNMWKIWVTKEIQKSEKLYMSLSRTLYSPPRIEALRGSCKCTDCSLPFGESILSKITDEKKAFELIVTTESILQMWYNFPMVRTMPFLNLTVDALLEMQKGVLGNTNILYLKLLAIKCLDIGGEPDVIRKHLLELEKNTVSVFGKYYPEMKRIYEELSRVYFALGNITKGSSYLDKIKRIRSFELQ